MKKFWAGVTVGVSMFASAAWAANEANYNAATGVVNIPKVAVEAEYYNVDLQQQGPGLNFSLTNALSSTSSSSTNIATYTPGFLHIPTVMVGSDSYTVDLEQGQGYNFTVTRAVMRDSGTPYLAGQIGNGDPKVAGTDIKAVYFTSDSNYLYWRMELFAEPNAQIHPTDFSAGYTVLITKRDGSTVASRVIYYNGQWQSVLMLNQGSWVGNPQYLTTPLEGKIPLAYLGSGDITQFPRVWAYVYLGNGLETTGIPTW
jgi:hypothetical protein